MEETLETTIKDWAEMLFWFVWLGWFPVAWTAGVKKLIRNHTPVQGPIAQEPLETIDACEVCEGLESAADSFISLDCDISFGGIEV